MNALRRIARAIANAMARPPLCPLCREPLNEGNHDVCRRWQAHR